MKFMLPILYALIALLVRPSALSTLRSGNPRYMPKLFAGAYTTLMYLLAMPLPFLVIMIPNAPIIALPLQVQSPWLDRLTIM